MASTSNANGYIKIPVQSMAIKQEVRAHIKSILASNFGSTLNMVPNMENLFMSLIQKESAFRPDAIGVSYGSTHINRILGYTAISAKYKTATAEERGNITNSCAGYGLAQVSGFYAITGCGPDGTGELQRMRSDVGTALMVNPGMDVGTKLIGPDNIANQVLAGLIVLEYKYKSSYVTDLVSSGVFNDKITAAIATYLGLIGAADANGMTPQVYASQIISGVNYQIANNGVTSSGAPLVVGGGTSAPNTVSSTGPEVTAASGSVLVPPGC